MRLKNYNQSERTSFLDEALTGLNSKTPENEPSGVLNF
jgi:hypothetical protein